MPGSPSTTSLDWQVKSTNRPLGDSRGEKQIPTVGARGSTAECDTSCGVSTSKREFVGGWLAATSSPSIVRCGATWLGDRVAAQHAKLIVTSDIRRRKGSMARIVALWPNLVARQGDLD